MHAFYFCINILFSKFVVFFPLYRLDSGLEILDKLRRRSTTERSTPHDSLEMVKVIYNSLKQRDCILHDQASSGHLKYVIFFGFATIPCLLSFYI